MKITKILIIFVLLIFQKQAFAQKNNTPDLFEICRNGDVATLTKMLKKDAKLVNYKQSNGFTPLIIASYNGQTEIAKILLEKGADINAQDKSGNTALMGLCFKGNLELIKLFLANKESKININLVNFNNASALIFAATFGHIEIAKALLASGADKNLKDNTGKTAFNHAVLQENKAMIEILR